MTAQPASIPRTRRMRSARTIMALMLREMATAYGRSAMGYLWAIVEPVAALALLSVVFGALFRSPALGTNFPLFFASGYLLFHLYINVNTNVARAVQYSRPLLEFPAVTPVDAIIARFLLALLTNTMVISIIVTGIVLVYDLHVIMHLERLVAAILLSALLGLGVGAFNCYLFVASPSYAQIWGIINRPMFILSGIFYLFESVPQGFQKVLWYNPMIHIIGLARSGIFPTYEAAYVSVPYVLGIALLLLMTGLHIMRRHLRDAMNL